MRFDPRTVMGIWAVVALAGCPGPEGTTGTESGTMTTTASGTGTETGTDTATGTGTATEGTTTEGTTTEGPTTAEPPTTGGGEGPLADCERQVAEIGKQAEQYCGCQVEAGEYPDVQSCLDFVASPGSACQCPLLAADAGNAGYLACLAGAEEAYTSCVAPLSCAELDGDVACSDVYFAEFAACGELTKQSAGAVEVQCYEGEAFMCGSGEQIPDYYTCDTEADCMDMSDETDTLCLFTCGSGEQIETYLVCDQTPDCMDMSDEAPALCLFTCDGGSEIPKDWVCDGEADCMDMTDEADCP